MSSAGEGLRVVYGIWGDDRGKVERAVRRLQDRVVAEGGMPAEGFDAGQVGGAEIVGACQTLSFGGLRLILVRGVELWRADDAAPVVAYLDAANPGTCLALIADGTVTPKLVGAVETAGQVLQFGPDAKARRSDRTKWFVGHVQSECDRNGAKLPTPLARTIVERVGEDAMALSREAEKLAAAAGRDPIDRELVDALVVENPEARAYELADAIVAGNRPRAFALLGELGSGDRPTDPAVIHSTLTRHFRGIAVAQALGQGATPDEVGDAAGLRGYPAQKALEHSRAIASGVGDRCVARLAQLELDLRVSSLSVLGRSGEDGRRFVVEVAARDLLGLTAGTR